MKKRPQKVLLGSLFLLIFYSCAVKKYIPEGELLYRGGKIHLIDSTMEKKDRNVVLADLEEALYPEPNSSFLGLYPGLHFFYKGQEKHPGFINRFLNDKLGEKPVYYSEFDLESTQKVFQNRLENDGYFFGQIQSKIKKDTAKKTAHANFTITPGTPYRLKKYKIEEDSTGNENLYKRINRSLRRTSLTEGQRFSLKDFKAERNRIDNWLKFFGYYYFNEDFLEFEADTSQYGNNKKFDLYLKLKENTPEKAKYPYVLDKVDAYANVYNDTIYGQKDTTEIRGVSIIESNQFFKPKQLRRYILLEPGQLYNPYRSRSTSRRLSSTGAYKFIDIRYLDTDDKVDSLGRRHLEAKIILTPFPKNSFQVKFQGVTKSNDFTGPGIEATFLNRNIFGGGESFSVKGIFGYEKQIGHHLNGGSTSLHLGTQGSLVFPRLIFPGNYDHIFKYDVPRTKLTVGMDYLNRSDLYSLNSFSTSFGYLWNQNQYISHEIRPINVDYVNLNHTSSRFEEVLDKNPFLKRSFEQQFIAGPQYTFTYNGLQKRSGRGHFYIQGNLDLAGNLLSLFGRKRSDGAKAFLGLQYAQYAKMDADVSYHYSLSRKNESSIVGHIFAGWGIPYGNSKSLPFVKQYFAGGPYSIRAFGIRSLGPGTYEPGEEKDAYFDRAGDIRLEANVEYRFPIVSIVKGALFMDAGNVWLQNKNEALPGGKFTSNFLSQLAYGAGFGLRFDIQGFVLRFDLASPLKRPNGKWKFEYNHPTFNFAVGYPF